MNARSNSNHLVNEKSPYLLQHAHNPVDWYLWGEEAFGKARKENKPVFLSIGYSTCHWCHVMAHESFEDEEVAELMNETFVSIKVDREERPDVDSIYMRACQLMTGSGGWPLTIIMTPDKKPFFATTYLPKRGRAGMPGMMELIPAVRKLWEEQREGLESMGERVVDAIEASSVSTPGGQPGEDIFKDTYGEFSRSFDGTYGGFGTAPKFPTPQNLIFLLRYWKRSGDKKALEMVEKTLQGMRLGGIYDHIGFGFHRYSTDREWHTPHFEKMLYDQAMIAIAYMEAYQATGRAEYGMTAGEILEYVLRDMFSPGGGFYSAEDADSEGKEGTFYIWDAEEMLDVLGEEDFEIASEVFNINDENRITHMGKTLADIAAGHGVSVGEFENKMEKIRKKLFGAREKRVHPAKDDKILTDWNGLMIASLAIGARVFGNRRYAEAAARSADFILEKMRTPDGLMHRYREDASISAYLNDYAFLIWGLIELYESTFDVKFLRKAIEMNDELIEKFWDGKDGGFYFTSDDGVLLRQKEGNDGAIPSGNAVSMLNMLRLGRITSDVELEEKAREMAKTFSNDVKKFPSAYQTFMVALDFMFGP
ncbi:MAG TPA: thioredoxin domain-containing protein, partial [Thermoplasmatales archaeon]|nr:thioredoxin domain-containing protein [Thermoplasmatales archaeon]